MDAPQPPTLLGRGVRVPWADLPGSVRAAVEEIAGGAVAEALPCMGGFSPGAAAALTLADGRRAFVKAVSTAQNPHTPAMYRQEAEVNAWLPAHPAIPALVGTYDDGDWVALVFEHVDATTPPLPWRGADLHAVLGALAGVQRAGTPAGPRARPVAELYADDFTSWRRLAEERPEGLDAWSAATIERCAEAESGWAAAAEGDTLLHTDLRADNVLVRDGRAWIVDWPWACAGAGWVDAVLMAPSVALQGGPSPERLMAMAYPDAPVAGVTAVAAALAGYFTRAALRPPPPGLPTLRAHQASSGRSCREWVARLFAG